MPWAPPAWCTELPRNAQHAVVTLRSQAGQSARHELRDSVYYLLKRPHQDADSQDVGSLWHAAVLRCNQGECYLMDLASASGTFMRGEQLKPNTPVKWQPGTTAVLGVPPNHRKVALELVQPQNSLKRLPETDCDGAGKRPKRQNSAQEGGSSGSQASSGPSKCDKCDGAHSSDSCPHFKKAREQHKDAWANYGKKHPSHMGQSGGKFMLRGARVVRQPGDGSCLFHSLSFGLNGGRSNGQTRAGQLRRELAQFVARNPSREIAGDTLQEWIKWDTNRSVSAYTSKMSVGGWGGGIEMAACSILKRVNVHVYESKGGAFKRISCFDSPTPTKSTIHVLYQGGVHYDALAVPQ